MSEVTIVIPARDRPDRLAATLASVRAQIVRPAATIVVDDGSAVPLAPGLAGWPDVRVIRHPASQGVAAARNAGILAAETEWVALLDDDDLWAPEKLELQLAAAEEERADWVFGTAIVVDGRGGILDVYGAPPSEMLATDLREANVIPAGSSNVLARRAALLDAGLFDTAFRHFADWDLWLRLAASARAASIPDRVVGYVRHPSSMQVVEIRSAQRELVELARKHAHGQPTPIGGVRIDRWLADGLAGAGHHTHAAALLVRSAVTNRSWEQFHLARWHAGHRVRRRLPARRRTPAPDWATPARFGPPVD